MLISYVCINLQLAIHTQLGILAGHVQTIQFSICMEQLQQLLHALIQLYSYTAIYVYSASNYVAIQLQPHAPACRSVILESIEDWIAIYFSHIQLAISSQWGSQCRPQGLIYSIIGYYLATNFMYFIRASICFSYISALYTIMIIS